MQKAEHKEEKKEVLQAGGHVDAFVKLDGGKIMKKVGKNEFEFYSKKLDKFSLKKFAPIFYGTDIKKDSNYIIIEDLTQYYKNPCILDVKMGTSSVGEDATPEKKESMHKRTLQLRLFHWAFVLLQ